MVGERVVAGRYRLEEPIGAGGMGEVWRATDLELGRIVAMKRSHDDNGAGQIRREGRIAAGLHHANVISVFDTVVDDGTKWLVMEYLPARSLSEIVRTDGPLSPDAAAGVGAQIASALAAMHERGMVHRDVTPANVLVTPAQVAKLTDFGISSWDELTITGNDHVAGTPAYMAPEAAAGHEVRFPADVFSLGAMLYAAVDGHSPWGTRDRTPAELRDRAVAGELTPPVRAGALTPVLTELLHPNPADRPTAENARRMLNAVGGTTIPNEPLTAPNKRRRIWALAAAGIVVVALAATAVAVGVFGSDDPGAPAAPVTGAGAVLDSRTADPCALVDPSSLSRFGKTVQFDSEYGRYNQCGLAVRLTEAEEDLGHVALFIEHIPEDVARGHEIGELGEIQTPAELPDHYCDRVIALPDGNQVRVEAYNQGARAAEPCDMAQAVAESARARLAQGPIPRRERPFPRESTANVDACTLLTAPDLEVVFGGQAPEPEAELGDWQCFWDGDEQEVTVEFSRQWQEPADDELISLGQWTGVVDAEDQACAVEIYGREYKRATDTGTDWVEMTYVVLDTEDESVDGSSLCSAAKVLAAAVAKRLPTG